MPATRPVGELRTQAAALILQKLKSVTVTQAASDLGVSRQAIYGFKSGTFCPSLAVIQRACAKWGLEFTLYGMKISEQTLSKIPKPEAGKALEPVQLTMFDLWDQLQDQRMTVVRARRVNGGVEMTLRISLSA